MNDCMYACVLVCVIRARARAHARARVSAPQQTFTTNQENTVATRLTLPIHRGFGCGGVIGACTA